MKIMMQIKILIWIFILLSIIFICLLYYSFEFSQIFNTQTNIIRALTRFFNCSWIWKKILCSNEFSSCIDHVCFQEFDNFFQWFAHKSGMWCHSQKCLCLADFWCCCMLSEALLHKTNKEWRIKKILVTFQQILTFLLFQCLTALELRFCLSWMLVLILSAVLIFFWSVTCASFCYESHDYRFLWCLETIMKSHDFCLIRFCELD